MAADGGFVNVLNDHKRRDEVQALSERCRSSGSAGLIAVGHLLVSLTEEERVASKFVFTGTLKATIDSFSAGRG